MQPVARGAVLGARALRVYDTLPGGHPVDVARNDRLHVAQAVAVDLPAFEKVGDGGEPDVRMRPHVDASSRRELHRPEMIEKNERSDHLGWKSRQQSLHQKAADVARIRLEQSGYRGGHGAS